MSTTTTTTTMAPELGIKPQSESPDYHTIDGLVRAQAARSDNPVLVAYPATDIDDFVEYTAKDLDRFADAAAAKYQSLGLEPADPTQPEAPVVALLAPSSFDIIITILAISRLNHALLFLSTRLAPAAYARLLEKAHCNTIIAAPALHPTISLISDNLPLSPPIPLVTAPDFRTPLRTPLPHTPPSASTPHRTSWILHSSGSTGHPTPIALTHRALLANFANGLALRAFCPSPLFHSHGLMELGRCLYRAVPMYMANHARPVTRANMVRAMRAARPELVTAVPFVLGLIAEGVDGVRELARARVVMFAGAACPDGVGDGLVKGGGVRLVANYGSTETGAIMNSVRGEGDDEWAYLRMKPAVAEHVLMDEIAPGVFECVALEGLASRGPTNCADPPNAWRTRDLFTRHPDPAKRGWWKYLTRLDDRLALVNGEKVLPLPIEGRIRQSGLVREAVMFGAGRTVPGVLVFRAEEEDGGIAGDEEFVERIWGDVEDANRSAESFSRIPRELVVVMPRGTEYPRTDKGTAVRQRVYDVFKDVIEEAYASFEKESQDTSADGQLLTLDEAGLEEWLMERFRHDLGVPLQSVETDIFAAGVDSLQTMRLWRLIRKTLDLGDRGTELSQNVVYEQGNVQTLANHLHALRTGEAIDQTDQTELLAMQDLIDKYSVFEQHMPGNAPQPDGEVILLTGTTGGLGAHILTHLLAHPTVTHIYAPVRAPSPATALTRILTSLTSRGIPTPSLAKLTPIPTTSLTSLDALVPALRTTLTCTIHAAWPVNFTLPVRAFAPHLQGLHALLALSLRVRTPRPAALYFASSVSSVGGLAGTTVPEAVPEALTAAQPMGYARSKLVAEKIVAAAAASTGMRARVLRVGQLVGDVRGVGAWNAHEAVPLVVRGVWSTGCLPALAERPSWLPVDVAAEAVVGVALGKAEARSGGPGVYHILNPGRFGWCEDLVPALKRTGRLPGGWEVVGPGEWLGRLEGSEGDVERNPARKLLGFWKGKYGGKGEGDGKVTKGVEFEMERTLVEAPVLGEVRMDEVLREEGWLERVLDRWIEEWGVDPGK